MNRRLLKITILSSASIALVCALVLGTPTLNTWITLATTRKANAVNYSVANVVAAAHQVWGHASSTTFLTVPFLKQKYSLSCEIASLRMALAYKGKVIDEDYLIGLLPFDTVDPIFIDSSAGKRVWGDPYKGFVGIINGKMPVTGYGVYDKPIYDIAKLYGEAELLENATLRDVINEVLLGNPIVVWGSLTDGKDISWVTPEGKEIKAIAGEHARVLVGFYGDPEKPTEILLIDPVYGHIRMSTEKFLKDWSLLGNMGVVIR